MTSARVAPVSANWAAIDANSFQLQSHQVKSELSRGAGSTLRPASVTAGFLANAYPKIVRYPKIVELGLLARARAVQLWPPLFLACHTR